MFWKIARLSCLIIGFATFCQWGQGQEATKTADDIVVKLLEPGAIPRQLIRLHPQKGAKQTAVMTMKMVQTIVTNGTKLPAPGSPPMQFTIDVTISDVASNGDISFDYTYSKVELVDDPDNPSPISLSIRIVSRSAASS